jgi:hypothetical protein
MSFVHQLQVGYFGPPFDARTEADFPLANCLAVLREYNATVPADAQVTIREPVKGSDARGWYVAEIDAHHIVYKRGIVTCPYLTTKYSKTALAFIAWLQARLECSIYSEDEGRFLTPVELVPKTPFLDQIVELAKASTGALATKSSEQVAGS